MKLPAAALPVHPAIMITDRPEQAFYLGAIHGEWANLEGYVTALYAVLIAGPGDLAQSEVFDHIRDTGTKRRIIAAVAKGVIKNRAYRATLNELLALYKRAGDVRNKFTHCRWLVSDKWPKKLIWVRRMTPNWMNEVELIGDRELDDALYEIIDARQNISDFIHPSSQFRVALKAFKETGNWPRQRQTQK